MSSKVLLLDLETAPQVAYIWQRWKANISVSQVITRTHLLCWGAKWLHEPDHYYSDSIHYHKGWQKDVEDDKAIVESLWELMDEADYVVAHNGDRFDVPLTNARFIQHGLQPPSTYQTIDTLKIAKRHFRFDSNKLEELAQVLLGRGKVETGGFELWRDCKAGKKEAFEQMMEYCVGDIFLLEDLYKKLKPYDKQTPHIFLADSLEEAVCPSCGSGRIGKNGFYNTKTQTYRKYKCKDCGHNMRTRKGETITRGNHNILRSI